MKERIVITQDWLVKDMKAGVAETDKLFICQEVEQVPETFDDLEKLVMEKCRGFTIRYDGIENKNAIECKGFIFHDCGFVEFEIKTKTIDEDLVIFTRCVAECMEFAQMWQIIKALTGEGK